MNIYDKLLPNRNTQVIPSRSGQPPVSPQVLGEDENLFGSMENYVLPVNPAPRLEWWTIETFYWPEGALLDVFANPPPRLIHTKGRLINFIGGLIRYYSGVFGNGMTIIPREAMNWNVCGSVNFEAGTYNGPPLFGTKDVITGAWAFGGFSVVAGNDVIWLPESEDWEFYATTFYGSAVSPTTNGVSCAVIYGWQHKGIMSAR